MIPNYTNIEFNMAKTFDELSLICEYCNKTFFVAKKTIVDAQRKNQRKQARFCSKKCYDLYQSKKVIILCTNCNKEFKIRFCEHKKSKNHFCSQSCSGTYNNTHKTKGYRRSKLEKYFETELIKLYPNLEFLFNNKNIINSELDIYIPKLKLAFELNGIFHYEPIYGQDKLSQIQNNDNRKFQACVEHGIELCIIDVSQQKYFKKQTSQKYLNIILNIINSKLLVNQE